MIAYASFEWLKLSRRWMPRIILLLMLGLIVIAFWGQSTRGAEQASLVLPRGWLIVLIFTSFFAPFFWPVLGGSWAGNEYGWGTIRMVYTRRPYRIEHALATLLVLVVGIGIALLAALVVGTVGGLLVGAITSHHSFPGGVLGGTFLGTLVKGFLSAWYISAFYLLLSYAAATVFRSAAVGIGFGIGSTLAEVVLRGIFEALGGIWKDISDQFPFFYTSDMTTSVVRSGLAPGSGIGRPDPSVPSVSQSVIVLAIYMAFLLLVTFAALRTRDVTA